MPAERQGARSLNVMCTACRHETAINVDQYPDRMTVSSIGPRMVCTACGHAGADVRPNWLEHKPPRVGDVTSRHCLSLKFSGLDCLCRCMASEIIEYRGHNLEVTSQGSGLKVYIYSSGSPFVFSNIPYSPDKADREKLIEEAKSIVDAELAKRGL
jgi:hypothetical protein